MQKRRPGRITLEKPPHNSAWLKAQLELAEVSQVAIAREMGADKATVSHLVNGRRPMRDDDVKVIAKMLGIDEREFLENLRNPNTGELIPTGKLREVSRKKNAKIEAKLKQIESIVSGIREILRSEN